MSSLVGLLAPAHLFGETGDGGNGQLLQGEVVPPSKSEPTPDKKRERKKKIADEEAVARVDGHGRRGDHILERAVVDAVSEFGGIHSRERNARPGLSGGELATRFDV